MGSGQRNEVPVPSDGYMTIQPSSSFVPEAKVRVAECSKQASKQAALLRLVEGTVYSTHPPRSWGSISLQESACRIRPLW